MATTTVCRSKKTGQKMSYSSAVANSSSCPSSASSSISARSSISSSRSSAVSSSSAASLSSSISLCSRDSSPSKGIHLLLVPSENAANENSRQSSDHVEEWAKQHHRHHPQQQEQYGQWQQQRRWRRRGAGQQPVQQKQQQQMPKQLVGKRQQQQNMPKQFAQQPPPPPPPPPLLPSGANAAVPSISTGARQSSSSSLLSLLSFASSSSGFGSNTGTETPPGSTNSPSSASTEESVLDETNTGAGGQQYSPQNAALLIELLGQTHLTQEQQCRQFLQQVHCSAVPPPSILPQPQRQSAFPPPPSFPASSSLPHLVSDHCSPCLPLLPSACPAQQLDLSHPVVCHFYLQQRHFFRQIYAQQLAALSARLGLTPPPERLIGYGHRPKEASAVFAADPHEPPHQHLGFPPAAPPPGQLISWMRAAGQQQMMPLTLMPPPTMPSLIGQFPEGGNTSCSSFYQISCMDVLSEHIFNFKQNTEQSTLELNRKLILRDQLYYAISPIFPMCGLYIVGSSLNGFGTKHSDLDLCLMITNRDIDQRSDAVVVLSSVMRTLENFSLVVDQQLILAKVPILRIKCGSAYEGIVIDLNVNNSVAIRNTHLMSYYSAFDWRVRPIVMVVKEWAKCRGINNASHSSFTSYSLVLMVIHYLQCGTDPPVLPSLQKIYPNRFSEKTDVRLLNISQPLDPLPCAVWSFDQGLTLSELLLGFLRYYAYNFNFDTDAISIRTGKKVNRAQVAQNQSPFNTLSQWHCICIEEPFTLSNAAHSVYDQRIFNYIKESFMKSYTELEKHRDLDQFLTKPSEEDGLRLVMPLPQQIMMIPNDKVGDEPITPTNYCL